MQAVTESLQNQLWSRLEQVFKHYSGGDKSAEIPTQKIKDIIVEALGQSQQQDIDYVMKNMFRLDADESGTVDFFQFANFLFKRHCGEMSLQKMHKANKVQKSKQRKINPEELVKLMNNAYAFLKVSCDPQTSNHLFKQTDLDKDGYITYVQYFQIINKYVCKPDSKKEQVLNNKVQQVPLGKERRCRLRIYMWIQLRKLYDLYIQGKVLDANDEHIRALLRAIIPSLSQVNITYILTALFKLNWLQIEFDIFAFHFFCLIAEVGLMRFSANHQVSKKKLNRDEFVIVFKNTFGFLNISRLKTLILWKYFEKIDKNQDGFISYEEYLDWIRRFIALLKYYGDQFYVIEDDADIQGDLLEEEIVLPIANTKKTQTTQTSAKIKFHFTDLSLSYTVRQRVFYLLQKFDFNKDNLLSQNQIQAALTDLLRENKIQLQYVTRNVFRYDRDGDQKVTSQEMTNFSVQQHFGEMAIQRLHRKNSYSRGKQRMMNESQFGVTLNFALQFIQLQASSEQISQLFKDIDLQKKGWITYSIYFLFLKYYFGSLSAAAMKTKMTKTTTLTQDQEYLLTLKDLSSLDRFIKLLLNQLRTICFLYDYNKNLVFQADQIERILNQVFLLNEDQINYVMYNFFRFEQRQSKSVTYQEMIAIILEIYFIEILFRKKYNSEDEKLWNSKNIDLKTFIKLILQACFFLRIKPNQVDLTNIFHDLDTNKDGFITFQQYINFIKKYLGKGLTVEVPKKIEKGKSISVPGVSETQINFIEAIWGQLKEYFDKYDSGNKGFHNDDDLKKFSIQVLKQTSQRQLDYIFWNLFRVDSNLNRQVQFEQFAPFILSHAGEIALQRFHKEQVKGKNILTQNQLEIVFTNAYNFLRTMNKSKKAINSIFQRIKKDNEVPYGSLLTWISVALSKKFR